MSNDNTVPFTREKTEHYQRVEAFMEYAGQIPKGGHAQPRELTQDERILRAKLIFEEAMETINALGVEIFFDESNKQPSAEDIRDWGGTDDDAALGDMVALNELNTTTSEHKVFEHEFRAHEHWDMSAHMEEFVDGIADISVVSIGSLVSAGVTDAGLLREVDAANLRKFPNGRPYEIREDGKCLKPPSWEPPNITQVLVDQGYQLPATEK
jgi:predicted HAD superfamily Cof-like phosphohydrolase